MITFDDVEVSFNGIPLDKPLLEVAVAINAPLPPWVVTAGGSAGEQIAATAAGSVGTINETKDGRTVQHAVKLVSVERLGNGNVRAVYQPFTDVP